MKYLSALLGACFILLLACQPNQESSQSASTSTMETEQSDSPPKTEAEAVPSKQTTDQNNASRPPSKSADGLLPPEQALQNLKPADKTPHPGEEPAYIKGVNLTYPLRPTMVYKGGNIYNAQCASCHSLGTDKKQASGFSGITKKRDPAWIINFSLGADFEVSQNAREAEKLAECPTRNSDGRLSLYDARDLLEFLRSNDGEK